MAGFSLDAEMKYWLMRRDAVDGVLQTIDKNITLQTDQEIDRARMKGVRDTITEIINRFEEYRIGRQPHIPGA